MVKGALVKSAVETVMPAAAEKFAKFCAHRRQPTTSLPIQDTPSPSSPFQKVMQQQQDSINDDHDHDQTNNDQPTATSDEQPNTTNAILRLDAEVKSILVKERTNNSAAWTEVLDENMTSIMDEQRMEATRQDEKLERQDEKLDDLRRILTKRDEAMQDQLAELLGHIKMNKLNDACDIRRRDDDKTKTTVINSLIQKDMQDGRPTAWSELVSNGVRLATNKTKTNKNTVGSIPMYTPDNGAERELESLSDKWTGATLENPNILIPLEEIINGTLINTFDVQVVKRIGTETGFTINGVINEGTNEPTDEIDFDKVVIDDAKDGYSNQ